MSDSSQRRHITIRLRTVILLLALLVAAAAAWGFSYYSHRSTDRLDRFAYTQLSRDIAEVSSIGGFDNQKALRQYITNWADANSLSCKVDSSGNIIFNHKASDRKKKVSPTLVCVGYNYLTAADDADLLAAAAMIAGTELNAGRRTVIFFNDVRNEGAGYRGIDKKYFKNKPKVIYLDRGDTSYMSISSFAMDLCSISIPAKTEPVKCDTAVRIHIGGIPTALIGSDMSSQPDPVAALSALLTRLRSRSVICQLADLRIGSNGCMYPDSIDATILLNSYSVSAFTKYIDKRIRAWDKAYGDIEGIEYTYEVIEDAEELPDHAYSGRTLGTLANVLYTVKSGTYTYGSGDAVPEGLAVGDVYGFNSIIDMETETDRINVRMMTQGYDEGYISRIVNDNRAASELFSCGFSVDSSVPAFTNDKDSLIRVLPSTYSKVNDLSGAGSVLKITKDDCFTPCSYFEQLNSNADIVHIRIDHSKAEALTNTVLCYIETKGNLISF